MLGIKWWMIKMVVRIAENPEETWKKEYSCTTELTKGRRYGKWHGKYLLKIINSTLFICLN